MKRGVIIAFVLVCGVAFTNCFAKKASKTAKEQSCITAIDDESYFYQDGYGKGHEQKTAINIAFNNAQRTLQLRVPSDSMEVEMVSNKCYYDYDGNMIAEVIIRAPRKQVPINVQTNNSPQSLEQLCDAVDDKVYYYQEGVGKHPDKSRAQMEAILNAKQLLQLRAKYDPSELEMVCNKLSIDMAGYWIANIVIRIPKNQ